MGIYAVSSINWQTAQARIRDIVSAFKNKSISCLHNAAHVAVKVETSSSMGLVLDEDIHLKSCVESIELLEL